jgi:hypothetical protein
VVAHSVLPHLLHGETFMSGVSCMLLSRFASCIFVVAHIGLQNLQVVALGCVAVWSPETNGRTCRSCPEAIGVPEPWRRFANVSDMSS